MEQIQMLAETTEMHWRDGANHELYHLGNGLPIVVVVWEEPREGYSTWEM